MKTKIAVATVSGKAYFLIVSELKRKNVPFLSLTPFEPVPIEVKVVVTTEEEKELINHEEVLAYKDGMETAALVNEALQIVHGKESFEKVTIGVDPGEVFGLAVLAGGRVVETGNCYSVYEALHKIETIIRGLASTPVSAISVKVGDGVPACKERLLCELDRALSPNVVLESVREAGTNRRLNEAKHRRGLRDIVSAIQIAGRSGYTFQRRKQSESYG
jgi:ABC-type sugar transport system ATPase subunit